MEADDEWTGWTINVRSAEAHELFSVAVQSSCLVAR